MYTLRSLLTCVLVIALCLLSSQTMAADRIETFSAKTPTSLRPVPGPVGDLQKSQKSQKKIIPSGYCCIDGIVSSSTERDCRKKRGMYFNTEREAALKCTGFCCEDGSVETSTQTTCEKKRGLFFGREKDAEKRCIRDRGFCCKDGSVSQSTVNSCKKDQGRFYPSEQAALQSCRGYCCSNRKITQLTSQQCARSKGEFFTSRTAAAAQCREVEGYCNENGKSVRMTEALCSQKKGTFFTTSALAMADLRTSEIRSGLKQKPGAASVVLKPEQILPMDTRSQTPGSRKPLPSAKDGSKALPQNNRNSIQQQPSPEMTDKTNLPELVLSTEEECSAYARSATDLAEIAERSYCHFGGDRWSQDSNKHFNWCMKASLAMRTREAEARLAELKTCNECGVYAQEAVNQYMQSEKNGCELNGTGWNIDRDTHFDWCMRSDSASRVTERENREEALHACGEIKLFTNPQYLNRPLDFCMYRREETLYNWRDGCPYFYGPMTIDFGWECGTANVATSFCISQEYDKAVDFKVSANLSSADTMTLGNSYITDTKSDIETCYSNIRQFDYIMCRKWDDYHTEYAPQKPTIMQNSEIAAAQKKELQVVAPETPEMKQAACEEYAQTSVIQYHQANNSWCTVAEGGFLPAAWNGDYNAHYQWCLIATATQRQNEIDMRADKLQECAKTERVNFENPTLCGRRVDTYLNPREGNKLESGVPQNAADAFCRRQGYALAVNIWFTYNSTYKPEILDETIHVGNDDNNNNCDLTSIDGLDICDSDWPSFRDDCEAFNHIICERPSGL